LAREANGTEVEVLIREGFLNVGTGVLDITRNDVKWIHAGGVGEIYTIDDLLRSEDMFLRSEVSLEESLKVPGIQLMTRMSTGMYPRETIAKVGLWQVSKSEEDWADVIINQLLGYREHDIMPTATDVMHILKQNMEYVNDDAPLLGIAIDATKGKPIGSIALVSTDNKLGKRVAARTGHHVL
jgi:hypothetical protein